MPPRAEVMGKQEVVEIGPLQVRIDVYRTRLRVDQLHEFYEKELTRRSWSRASTLVPVPKMPNMPEGWEQEWQRPRGVLFFKKRDQAIAIRMEPEGMQTLVIVNDFGDQIDKIAAQPDAMDARGSDAAQPIVPATAHDPTGLPVYPNAMRIAASGAPADQSLTRMYSTKEPDGVIVDFYREAMRERGWTQSNVRSSTQPITVPPSAQKFLGAAGNTMGELRMTELEFQRRNERCQVIVTRSPAGDLVSGEQETAIFVQWMSAPEWVLSQGER